MSSFDARHSRANPTAIHKRSASSGPTVLISNLLMHHRSSCNLGTRCESSPSLSKHHQNVEVIRMASTELHGLTVGVHRLRWRTTACYRIWLQIWLRNAKSRQVCIRLQVVVMMGRCGHVERFTQIRYGQLRYHVPSSDFVYKSTSTHGISSPS